MGSQSEDRWEELARRVARIEEHLESEGFERDPDTAAKPASRGPPPLPLEVPKAPHSATGLSSSLEYAKIVSAEQKLIAAQKTSAAGKLETVERLLGKSAISPGAEVAGNQTASSVASPRAPALPHLALPHPPTSPVFAGYSPASDRDTGRGPVAVTRGMEQAIGLKLAGWVGAIVVVIGAALGIKFGYDQGWLGGMPPAIKLGILYAVGVGLIATGEWVYRKINPLAAVGIYAAGIAGLFVVSYAGNSYFQLYDRQVAFALMAGACAIGALISLRGGLVSIAILSLLGANLAPLILRKSAVGEVPLLAYLLALQVMAIGLAHVGKGARWWILRNFALVSLMLWMTGRLAFSATAFSLPTLLFLCLYAVLFQVENALATRRGSDGLFSHPTFSFAVTVAFTFALLRWSMPLSDLHRGAIMVGLSMLAFTVGAATISNPSERMRALAQGWLVQGGILLFAAVPVALAGPWIVIAWAVMALGYAALGVVLKRSRSSIAGVIIWFAALIYFVAKLLLAGRSNPLLATLFEVHGDPIPMYFVLGAVLSMIGQLIALLFASRRLAKQTASPAQETGVLSIGVAVTAAILSAVVSVAALPPLWATLVVVAIGWVLFFISRTPTTIADAYRALSAAAISLALAKWVAIDLVGGRFAETFDPSTHSLLINATMGVGAFCVGSLWLIARLITGSARTTGVTHANLMKAAVVFGVASLTLGLCFELHTGVHRSAQSGAKFAWSPMQLTHFGWTLLCSIAAVSLPLIGRSMRVTAAETTELKAIAAGSLTLVSIKFLLVDTLFYTIDSRVAASPLINAHTLTAAVMLGLLIYGVRSSGHVLANQVCRAAMFLIPLAVGSSELDRLFGPRRALVAFSLFWGLYSILSIAVGFKVRSSILRFAGLGLLGITLFKVVFVDLANAGTGWRILSFLGLGAILLATSVLYGRLSPRLLDRNSQNVADPADLEAPPPPSGQPPELR